MAMNNLLTSKAHKINSKTNQNKLSPKREATVQTNKIVKKFQFQILITLLRRKRTVNQVVKRKKQETTSQAINLRDKRRKNKR